MEDQGTCVNSSGATCSATRCECNGIKPMETMKARNFTQEAIKQVHKWDDELNIENNLKLFNNEETLSRRDFYRNRLVETLSTLKRLENENKSER